MELRRRKSRLRERIYAAIKASKEHPTAQDVYEQLKRETPSLSLGTVYRNIAILLAEGRIQGGEFGGSTVRYDAVISGHYHFVCETCGAVSDFAMPEQAQLTAAARRLSPHRILGHAIRFYGVCAGCAPGDQQDQKSKSRRR